MEERKREGSPLQRVLLLAFNSQGDYSMSSTSTLKGSSL